MSTVIHRNNAPRTKILASNVYMGLGDNKNENVESKINELEERECDVVRVTPIVTEGVHIADVSVNGNVAGLYAPEGGGQGTVTDVKVDGTSVVDVDGVANITMPTVPEGLNDLSDVDAQSPSDGDVLKYNSETQKWENGEAGGSGTVTDVQVDGTSVVDQDGIASITMPAIPVDDVNVNGTSVVDANKVAQITSYKELTQSEYDLLPNSKYTDGVLYCIKDDGIVEGDKYAPIIYSLDEREVGVWTDGKPIYKITIDCGSLPNNSVTPITTPNNIENIVDYSGFCYSTSNLTNQRPIPFAAGGTNDIRVDLNTGTLRISTMSDWSGYKGYLTIQYTKTTDVPGSGHWGTDGVPMVHYDGTERVVGTWFGETLYEKSYHTHFVTDAYSLTIPFTDISNLGNVLDIKGAVMQSDSADTYNATGNTIFNVVPFTQAVLTISTVTGWGIFGSSGIKVDRTSNTAYGSTPHVFVTIQYTKTSS